MTRSGRQPRLQVAPRLLEQTGRGAQPAGERLDPLGGRAELAHEQRQEAEEDVEVRCRTAVLDAAQLEIAQLATDYLQAGEGVDRRRPLRVVEQGQERPLVSAEHGEAARDRRRRPRGQPAGAGGQAEPGGQHRVVGEEIVEQRLDGRFRGTAASVTQAYSSTARPRLRRTRSRMMTITASAATTATTMIVVLDDPELVVVVVAVLGCT